MPIVRLALDYKPGDDTSPGGDVEEVAVIGEISMGPLPVFSESRCLGTIGDGYRETGTLLDKVCDRDITPVERHRDHYRLTGGVNEARNTDTNAKYRCIGLCLELRNTCRQRVYELMRIGIRERSLSKLKRSSPEIRQDGTAAVFVEFGADHQTRASAELKEYLPAPSIGLALTNFCHEIISNKL
jgi:hypothetical protein